MRPRFLTAVLLALAALASGCALSPQTIEITPVVQVVPAEVGNGHSVQVLANDNRSSPVLGSRGGVYGRTSTISSGNDVAEAVREAMQAALGRRGFEIVGGEAQTRLTFNVEQLSYSVPAGTVATSADISIVVKAIAERSDLRHEATYRSTLNRRFPVAPSAAQNELYVSELLGETLQRFFSDERMQDILVQP